MGDYTQGADGRVRISSVLHPVADLASAITFYTQAFRIEPRFIDGTRFAQLATDGAPIALTSATERLSEGPAATIRVADVHVVLDAIVAAGGAIIRPAHEGPHELRAVARDPWDNTMIVYSTP